jgi:BlaI family transcriptional regulator, penicillinase repressor
MQISDAESKVMHELWREAPLAADEVIARLQPHTGWHEKTIRTLLNRLLGKGALAADRDGRRYLYRPLIARDDYRQTESRSFVQRVFDGRLSAMLAHFGEHEQLGEAEIAELRAMLDRIEREDR